MAFSFKFIFLCALLTNCAIVLLLRSLNILKMVSLMQLSGSLLLIESSVFKHIGLGNVSAYLPCCVCCVPAVMRIDVYSKMPLFSRCHEIGRWPAEKIVAGFCCGEVTLRTQLEVLYSQL